jgi:hypothetical protein
MKLEGRYDYKFKISAFLFYNTALIGRCFIGEKAVFNVLRTRKKQVICFRYYLYRDLLIFRSYIKKQLNSNDINRSLGIKTDYLNMFMGEILYRIHE